jgi:hypothetical protein
MERLLSRLERKLGRYAIHNLTAYLVAAMGIAFIVSLGVPGFLAKLVFHPALVAKQPWSVVTWLAVPTSTSVLFIIFTLSFYYFIGNSLEHSWGAFKYNVYLLVGALATLGVSIGTHTTATNQFLMESLVFAVATIAPNFEINFFFFPIRMKWIGLIGAVFVIVQFVSGDAAIQLAVGAGIANYFLFFSGHLLDLARGRRLEVRQAARRASFRPPPKESVKEPTGRACAICGKRQDDGEDIRVCSCEKCGGKTRELCLEHARNH